MRQNTMNSVDEDEIDLLELAITIWNAKKLIIAVTLLGTICAVVIAILIPKQYVCRSTFLPVARSSQGLSDNLGGLASMVGISMPSSNSSNLDYEVLLNSQRLTEKVIEQLNLLPLILSDLYDPETGELLPAEEKGILSSLKAEILQTVKDWIAGETTEVREPASREKRQFLLSRASKALKREIVSVQKDKSSGLITIQVTWTDSKMAAKIANAYLNELEKFLQKNNLTTTQKSRMFIEEQLEKAERELRRQEEQLKEFSETYGIYSIEDQASSLSQAIGQVKGEIILEQVKLDVLTEFKGRDNQEVHLSKLKLDALKKELAELERGNTVPDKLKTRSISLKELPALGLEYGRLKRELAIQQEIYKMLRTKLETTKIEEEKDTNAIQVIDYAVPSEFPAKPNRKLIVVVGTMVSFIMAVFLVFFIEFVRNMRREYRERKLEAENGIEAR